MRMKAGKSGGLYGTKFWVIALLLGLHSFHAFSQDKQVQGLVIDQYSKERIARVSITNLASGITYYNDLKGEFKLTALPGDKLVFVKEYYFNDTVQVKNYDNLIIYLARNSIMLREVTIRDSLHTPMQQLMATRREYSKAYGSNAFNNPFSSISGGGVGLSLDAIYNSFSRSGRNAAHLQELIQQDYQQNVIDYRFNRSVVSNVTKLKGTELTEFMIRYRPSYYTVTSDTEYEFITYIRTSLRRYQRAKKTNSLAPIKVPQS